MRFLKDNARWLATGLLLAFGSSFGQTYFISLFAGEIRADYGLSDGQWGLLYTVATLSSAALLLGRGSWADTVPLHRLAPIIAATLGAAALLMALGWSVWTLGLAVFLLRFAGQGMLSHIKVTAMARWFVATRGRAMAITNLGYPLGEILTPLPTILLIGLIGWRPTWGIVALIAVLGLMPLLMWLLKQNRAPAGADLHIGSAGLRGRHWTRSEVLRHWSLWALVPMLLTPGFIGTVIFFHQVHVSEVKGWSLTAMAPGYLAYASATVGAAFVAGWACDRFGPARLLPIMLLPMAVGITMMQPAGAVVGWIIALGILGLSQGMSGAVWGTLLPWAYGTKNLGSIRALATATMVLSTAIGPGITGALIDNGIPFPDQGLAMGIWCIALSVAMIPVARGLIRIG
jgi:MFS family permease